MTRQLVLVHGRSQQHKDPDSLKAEWLTALRVGLGKSGLDLPIAESDVHFPYYGDTLADLVAGRSADQAARVIVRGDGVDAEEREFMRAVLDEARQQAGITDAEVAALADAELVEKGWQNWGWVQAISRAIDRKVSGGSGLTIALATHDVYSYLVEKSIKDEIDEGVSGALSAGAETVVVAHSLGTVVAHSVLKEQGKAAGWSVPLFVTVGSPLAVSRIRTNIVPPRWPACVDAWCNARDPNDIVALYPLTAEHFNVGSEHSITNTNVHNHTDNKHGITGYLDDSDVARRIHAALTG